MVDKITAFTFNHSDQPNVLTPGTYSSTELKQKLDSRGEQLRVQGNAIIDAMGLGSNPISVTSPPYYASGLNTTFIGSITSGKKELTITTTPDFIVNNGINLQGVFEVASLVVGAAATSSDDCTITLNGVDFTVALTSGDTAIECATAIRAATFTGWTAGGTALSDTVTFTSTTTGVKTDATYDEGTTGATGTMTTTTQGTADQISTVSSVTGKVITIADNATRTITAGTILHDDTVGIQAAIDYAIDNDKAVFFGAMCPIVGSITITKTTDNRKPLHLIGGGGGIRKDNSGYIFTADSTVCDIVSQSMRYESTDGVGAIVWDGNNIIRLSSNMDSYRDFDTVIEAETNYSQSVRFLNCTITGGSGWAFTWAKSFDTTIKDCTIEHRENGIRNTVFTANPDNDNLRIIDNVLEGLTGKTALLGASFAVEIIGNYCEANVGGYFDMTTSTNSHNGLVIESNSCQQTADQKTDDIPFFDINKIGAQGIDSGGNAATGVLYKCYSDGSGGVIASKGDISFNDKKVIGSTNKLSEMGRVLSITNGRIYGRVAQYEFSAAPTTFSASEIKEITISTSGITLNTKDTVTVNLVGMTGSFNVSVLHWRRSGTDIIVRIQNNSAGSNDITAHAVILQIV